MCLHLPIVDNKGKTQMWWGCVGGGGCECFSFNVTVVVSCRCSCFVVVVVPWFGLCRTKRLRKQQETVTKIKSGKRPPNLETKNYLPHPPILLLFRSTIVFL